MLTDIEIAHRSRLRPIIDVAAEAGLDPSLLELHGNHKAKVDNARALRNEDSGRGHCVVVTAVTPTTLSGAGFFYALCRDVLTMPGLPAHPAGETIDIDAGGTVKGLF